MKYYQIREFETDHPESHDGVVSEEVLKQRCEIVASILAGHSPGIRGWNEARDVLINGD